MSEIVLVPRPAVLPKGNPTRSLPSASNAASASAPARGALTSSLAALRDRRLLSMSVGPCRDAVTGLLNRNGLEQSVTSIVESGSAKRGVGAMLCVDLGGPDVMEDLAHASGQDAVDDLLLAAADVLRHSVRGVDAIGRLGGDDFVIVLEGLGDLGNAARIAETVLLALRRLSIPGARGLMPRIGVTRLPASARAVVSMFAARELALGAA